MSTRSEFLRACIKASVLTVAMLHAACKPPADATNLNAIVGTGQDGKARILAFLPVRQLLELRSLSKEALQLASQPMLVAVECREGEGVSAAQAVSAMADMEKAALAGTLAIGPERDLSSSDLAAGAGRKACAVIGERLLSIQLVAAMKFNPDSFEKAPSTAQDRVYQAQDFLAAQTVYLALYGRSFPAGKRQPQALEAFVERSGDKDKVGLLYKLLSFAPTFVPCDRGAASDRVPAALAKLRDGTFRCVPSKVAGAKDFAPGATGELYGLVTGLALSHIARQHAVLNPGSGITTGSLAAYWDALTTTTPWSGLTGASGTAAREMSTKRAASLALQDGEPVGYPVGYEESMPAPQEAVVSEQMTPQQATVSAAAEQTLAAEYQPDASCNGVGLSLQGGARCAPYTPGTPGLQASAPIPLGEQVAMKQGLAQSMTADRQNGVNDNAIRETTLRNAQDTMSRNPSADYAQVLANEKRQAEEVFRTDPAGGFAALQGAVGQEQAQLDERYRIQQQNQRIEAQSGSMTAVTRDDKVQMIKNEQANNTALTNAAMQAATLNFMTMGQGEKAGAAGNGGMDFNTDKAFEASQRAQILQAQLRQDDLARQSRQRP